MDPNAAYSFMTDETEDIGDRAEIAEHLAEWITRGGFLPSAPWSTAPAHFRRSAILAECRAVNDEIAG